MKLGILCTMINGFGRKGYYNTQEIGLGRALVRLGHTVVIYKCIKREGKSEVQKEKIEPGLVIYYLPTGGLGAHGFLPSKVLARDLDGILCFSDNQVFLPHIYHFCQKNGIGFVPYVGTTFSLHKGLRAWGMNAWFASGTCKIYRDNPVIAKTEGSAAQLSALGVNDVTVAPVGLDTAVLKSDYRAYDRGELRAEYGFDRDDVIICDVARLEPEKRPLDMIDIFCRVREKKNFKLLFVGDGPLAGEVDEKIASLGLEADVRRISRIPYSQVWKIFSMSDYFVSLNRGEIFGMAIMEAVYYGVATAACAAAPGPSLILKEMDGHLLYSEDGELEEWLTAPAPSRQFLERSAEKVVERFSWNRCAETFVSILQRSGE